ncbi:Uu.00g012840.m01.CDS01 [Anthostomella pinea]|uniref:Uu.00g012840.m01.CDS01 n=1 Tax=Anthostomella pinea TaxID=933095 RepID=A0AAI8VYM4_9PEZI|nr:Uu.00g012840.m01.CDS01 [Anthostomella pinea]
MLWRTANFRWPKRHVLTLPVGNDEPRTVRVGIIDFVTEQLESWKSESSWAQPRWTISTDMAETGLTLSRISSKGCGRTGLHGEC